MERPRRATHSKRREPVEDHGDGGDDRPEVEPDEVWDDERQAEEDRQPRPAQVVRIADETHRMLRRRLHRLQQRSRVGARVDVGDEQRVCAHLRPVTDAVRAGVAQPPRHAPEHERREPAEHRARAGQQASAAEARVVPRRSRTAAAAEGAERETDPASQQGAEHQCGNREDDPKQRLPARLPLRLLGQLHVDRVRARFPGESRLRVGGEVEVRTQVDAVADVRAEEAVQPHRRLADDERREPVEDRGRAGRGSTRGKTR